MVTTFLLSCIKESDIKLQTLKQFYNVLPVSASSPSGEGPQPQYNVNNLPKTSFTCGNKPHDGLYADLETRCQVFHFCRTISGVMTLESSFVCPPGKVFNQAEKDCGARKEVVCALYSVPQHSFETSTSTGTKVGNNYHITEKGSQIKLRMFKSPKKEDENYKMKREAEIEASDYYDYVDDNYEAHVAKPINKDMSSENDQIEKSKSVISVEDYDYESENDKRPESHLLEHQKNEDDDQESLALVGKVTTDSDGSNRTSSQPHESFVEYTTESTSFAIELNLSESKATIPVLDETAMQNKSDGREVKDTDDYVYSDENMTSVPENTEQTNHTLEENSNIKNYSEFITLVPSHDVKSFRQSDTLETNGHVKTDANITSLTDVIFPTNATQIILYMNKNDTLKPDQNLEIKTVPKLDSFNSDVTLDDYEYYYDEEYGDSKETKTDSNSEHLPSAKTDDEMFIPADECGSEKQSDYCVHDVVGEGIEEQMQRPTVDIEENASDNGSSSFNLTTKASEKSNTKPPVSSRLFENSQTNFRTGINEHSAQKSNFTETDIILELFETSTNSSPLEEIERKAEVTTSTGETDKKLFQNRNSDRITSAFLTSQLQKKTPSRKETANFGLVSNEQAAVSHKINSPTQNEHILDSKAISEEATTDLGLVVTTVKPQKGSISPIYNTTSYINVIPLPQVEKSLPQLPQRHADQTTDPQAAQSPFPQAVSILSERRKPHNVFINYFSTPLPPPVVIKSREMPTSRKPTIARSRYRGVTNYVRNNTTKDETNSRKLHKITVLPNENPVTDGPLQMLAERNTATALPPSLVADEPIAALQEKISQNAVPKIQTSEIIITTEETSTVPYPQYSAYDVGYEFITEIPASSTKDSEISANTTNKLLYSNNEALYPSSTSEESILSSKLRTLSPLKNSLPSSTPEYYKNNFSIVNSSIVYNDIELNHSTPDDSSTDNETKRNLKLIRNNSTTARLPINGLSVPITVASNMYEFHRGENTELLPNTSPSSNLGYTLSSVSVSRPPGFVCTGRELHQYHPDPDDCRMFHYCSPGFHIQQVLDFRFMCENGTAFKTDTQKCENDYLISTCKNLKDKK